MKKDNTVHLVQIFFLAFAGTLVIMGILPLRNAARERAELIKQQLISTLEEQLNLELRYDSISPALLSALTVKNLRMEFPQGEFRARRSRIVINPFARFKKDSDPLDLITRIIISDARLEINQDKWQPAGNSQLDVLTILKNKTLIVRDMSTVVSMAEYGIFRAQDVDFQLDESKNYLRYELNANLNSNTQNAGMETLQTIGNWTMRISSVGNISPQQGYMNGRMNIAEARSDYIRFKPVSVDFTYGDENFSLRKIDDARPFDFSMSTDASSTRIAGEFLDVSINDVAALGNQRNRWAALFDSKLNGNFSLDIAESSALDYEVNLKLAANDDKPDSPIWTLALDASGNNHQAFIDKFELAVPQLITRYSGRLGLPVIEPAGQLEFEITEDFSGEPVHASFRVETIDGVIMAVPDRFNSSSIQFHDFRFLVTQENRRFVFSLLAVPELEGRMSRGRLILDAFFDFENEPLLYGFAAVEDFESSILSQMFNMPFLRNAMFNFSGRFEANRHSWLANIENASIVSNDNQENTIIMKGRVKPGFFSVDSLKSQWNGFIVNSRAFVAKTDTGGTGSGWVVINDESFPLYISWSDGGALSIDGPQGLDISIASAKTNGQRSLSLVMDTFSIPLKEGRFTADMKVKGRIGTDEWLMDVLSSHLVFSYPSPGREHVVELEGSIRPNAVNFPRVQYSDSLGTLSGEAVFEQDAENLYGGFILNAEDSESYRLAVNRENGEWDADILIQSAKLARLGNDDTQGEVEIRGYLKGNLQNPDIQLEVFTEGGFLEGRPFEVKGKANLKSGNLKIHDLQLLQNGVFLTKGLIFGNFNTGEFRGTADFSATYNQILLSTGLSFNLKSPQLESIEALRNISEIDYSGTVMTEPVFWGEKEHFPRFTFQIERNRELFFIQTPQGRTLNINYQFDSGQLSVLSAYPMPFEIQGGGILRDNVMDLNFPYVNVDPVLINYVMVRDPLLLQYHVVFQSGRFIGNLALNGPTTSPEMYGKIRALDLQVDTPYTYAEILPASTDVFFEGNRISFERIDVPVGDGVVYGEGYLVLDAWKIIDFNMIYGALPTDKGDGVPIYYPLFSVFLDGLFTGEVRMTGSHTGYKIDGDITFPYLKASLRTPLVPVPQRRPGKKPTPVLLNLTMNSGNNCTFFLPNEQFKILRATAEPNNPLFFMYDNSPKALSLSGTMPMRSGNIYYFDRDFQITEGQIDFNESLGDFDPVMSLRAETRVRDEQNDEITVALVYDAPIRSDFNPRIETIPTRSDIEILALFGRAVIPYGESGEGGVNSVLLATSGVFAQAGIVQPFEDILREGLNLDIVTIQTDIIENALLGSLNRSADGEFQTQISGLGRFLDNTSLFAGKYIGNALFVSGSLSTRYFEGQRLRSIIGGLEFEPALSIEMTTPFFNVGWSYSPDAYEQNNFIADNSISLKWHFLY